MKPLPLPGFLANHVTLVVWMLRLLVGGTFIVSGLAKLIDEWGFVLKIEQYLAVWDFSVPRTIVLAGAIFLSAIEFMAGALLLTGCYRRFVAWLITFVMLFMLPLTFYIMIANPVTDCGCFGDFLIISNTATFVKNVFLTIGALYLVSYNRKVKGLYLPFNQWAVMLTLGVYALVISLVGYNVQPLYDFRPYPVGSTLLAEDVDDEVKFVYEKDGERALFSPDSLPDSDWTYVDRLESPSTEPVKTLVVYDGEDEATDYAIATDGEQLLVLIPDLRRADVSYTYLLNEFYHYINDRGGVMAGIISASPEGVEAWVDYSMAEYQFFTAEETAIEEIARGNIALVYLKDGIIEWKRNMSTIPSDILKTSIDPLEELKLDGERDLAVYTAIMIASLLFVGLFQELFKSIYQFFHKRKLNK